MRTKAKIAVLTATIVLTACATAVKTSPVTLTPAPGAKLTLERSVEIQLPTQYSRTLAQGSAWQKVGSLPQGDVYRPVGTIFTIEGRNVHEAYLIVSPAQMLVGFYLPGESSVSMLPSPVQLSLKESP